MAVVPLRAAQTRRWVGEGVELTRRVQSRLRPEGPDLLRGLKVSVSSGPSLYDPAIGKVQVHIPSSPPEDGVDPRLIVLEDTVHESTHHMIRRAAGFPGLLAGAGPGRVGEGLAQTVAGTTLALEGDAEERAWGWRALDPSGQTTPVGEFKQREVPLSLDWKDLHDGRTRWYEDMGGVHVHGAIVTRAHGLMAQRLGLEPMARVTFSAMDALTPVTGVRSWARATVRAAQRLYGPDAAEADAVRDAWEEVSLPSRPGDVLSRRVP